MPKQTFLLSERIPEPARTLLNVVQMTLKLSRNESASLVQEGGARVNGRICTRTHEKLEPGDRIDIDWIRQPPKLAKSSSNASDQSFRVIFHDESILVVNKPANLLTVPTPHRESKTLLSLVNHYLERESPDSQAYCVHRLDRGVSGLLVFAKSISMAEIVRSQFAARKPDRQYVAICAGVWPEKKATIRSFLATDENLNRYSTSDREAGELAITHIEVAKLWDDASLLKIHLETGRRNQIRVHLAEANHPILGDPRYRSHQATHRHWPYRRLALHAESLGFEHPVTGEKLSFTSSWPDEFRAFQRSKS